MEHFNADLIVVARFKFMSLKDKHPVMTVVVRLERRSLCERKLIYYHSDLQSLWMLIPPTFARVGTKLSRLKTLELPRFDSYLQHLHPYALFL